MNAHQTILNHNLDHGAIENRVKWETIIPPFPAQTDILLQFFEQEVTNERSSNHLKPQSRPRCNRE